MKNKRFAHLHVHTTYSQLDGYGTPEQYVKHAKKMGFTALGISDHGNIDGLIKFQKACDNNGIDPVLGCELYIVSENNKQEKRGHACVWVKNATGFKNLCKMLSWANIEGFYKRPRVTHEILLKHCKGLVISTACVSGFVFKTDGLKLLRRLHRKIKDDLYMEIMPHDHPLQVSYNSKIIKEAKKRNIKLITTTDCHYIQKKDRVLQEVLLAIQRNVRWKDPKRWKFDFEELFMQSVQEMRAGYDGQGLRGSLVDRSIKNTMKIVEKCRDYRIPKLDIKLPRVAGIKINKQEDTLKQICLDGYKKIFGKPIGRNKIYKDRFREEFNLIKKKKFSKYFLIVWELINWCKENKILTGPGRGSVGGSLIAYLMGITAVDPIEHGLLFSRFINEDRIDYPDIDIDFEHIKRHLIKMRLEEIYGSKNVAGVSSFNRMGSKYVIKDVCRVFDVPFEEANAFTNLMDKDTTIQDAIDAYEEGQEFYKRNRKVVRIAKKLEGQVRSYGQHAAAVVVSKESIADSGRCSLRIKDDMTLINWEKDDTEFVGLMKLDILGLKLLSIFNGRLFRSISLS